MQQSSPQQHKLGLIAISAIVFGSMIGSGIFNIAQNMADGAQAAAVAISWAITAAGMLCLVYTFKLLNTLRPDLNAGIYQYALAGFGNYAGFNIAWGYWICTACGNVAYVVMLNDSLGVFFPALLGHSWPTVALGSALIWMMFAIVARGVKGASALNTAITALKLSCLGLVVVVLIVFFDRGLFFSDIWGEADSVGPLSEQIKSTMMVTLWCFVGIEGAIVMSARARRQSDVGKAGMIGFLLAWLLYVLVSLLCFGVMSRADMAALENPSIAYVLRHALGPWAYYFVICAIIVALFGGLIAWTLLCAQVPGEAAKVGVMPRMLLQLNRYGSPWRSLLVSTLMMQILILVVVTAEKVYMAAVVITSMMVLPAYLFSALFLLKASFSPVRLLHLPPGASTLRYKVAGTVCSLYCLWLIYAGGLRVLAATSLCYLAGAGFYIKARHENAPGQTSFTRGEKALLLVLAVVGAWIIVTLFGGGAL